MRKNYTMNIWSLHQLRFGFGSIINNFIGGGGAAKFSVPNCKCSKNRRLDYVKMHLTGKLESLFHGKTFTNFDFGRLRLFFFINIGQSFDMFRVRPLN